MAAMTTMPRCLQTTGLAGGVATAAAEVVSFPQSISLRCAWKAGRALKASRSNLSASVPSRIRRAAAPRSNLGPSGGGGGETESLLLIAISVPAAQFLMIFCIFEVLVKNCEGLCQDDTNVHL